MHRTLAKMRKEHPALRLGDCKITVFGDDSLLITREYRGESVFCAITRGEMPSIGEADILYREKQFVFYK